MRTKRVTETWEYYRVNCPGFKEPMRKRFRELDEYVAGLEELCADMWCCIDRHDHHDYRDDLTPCHGCQMDDSMRSCNFDHRMDELGIPRK